MKKRVKEKQQLRKTLRRLGACMTCGVLLGRTAPEDSSELTGDITCPACGRKHSLDFSGESLKEPETQETLRRFAVAVAVFKKIPATQFTFMLDDKIIMSDPECGCEDQESCPHATMTMIFNTSK